MRTNYEVEFIKCSLCDGLGGIPVSGISIDDPDWAFVGGVGGIKCPKCKGVGRVIAYKLSGDYQASYEVRLNLFYDIIKQEMYERNWGYTELSYYSGCMMSTLFDLLHKKIHLNDELARGLAKAFETSPELWIKLYSDTTEKANAKTQ